MYEMLTGFLIRGDHQVVSAWLKPNLNSMLPCLRIEEISVPKSRVILSYLLVLFYHPPDHQRYPQPVLSPAPASIKPIVSNHIGIAKIAKA